MKITGAIFDFDGTIFDSMHVWRGIKKGFIESLGVTFTKEDEDSFKSVFLMEALQLAKDRFNLPMSNSELCSLFFDYLTNLYVADTKPKNDIIPFLKKLKENNVKIAIATASGTPAVEAALKKFGMREYFDAIISTYDVFAAKTEPTVYRATHEAIGTPKESTYIFEDALYAAKTAKADGFKVIAIYDKSEPNQEELKALADEYVFNFGEVKF